MYRFGIYMQKFTDAEFMSAQQKEKVMKQWICFLESNLQQRFFLPELYQHIYMRSNLIAHFDRKRFYERYFTSGDGKIEFLEHFDEEKKASAWIADPRRARDYDDLNAAMIEGARKYLPVLYASAIAEQRDADLELVERLLNRHGMTISNAVSLERRAAVAAAAAAAVQGDLFTDATNLHGARV